MAVGLIKTTDRDAYLRDIVQTAFSEEQRRAGNSNTVLKSGFSRSDWYAAVLHRRAGRPAVVVAHVYRIHTKGQNEFSYEAQDESEGPCAVACPIKVFNLLMKNEPINDAALDWRRRVAEHYELKRHTKDKRSELVGSVVTFTSPLNFGFGPVHGGKLEEIEFGANKRKRLVIRVAGYICDIRASQLETAVISDAAFV